MILRLLADAVVLLHVAYIVYVLLGALLVRRWPRTVWLHLGAVAWAVYIAATGGICPLTPLEIQLRVAAGQVGYAGGFVEHYILPVLYPAGLTRAVQVAEAIFVVAVNLGLYTWMWRARRRAHHPAPAAARQSD